MAQCSHHGLVLLTILEHVQFDCRDEKNKLYDELTKEDTSN